MQGQLRVRPQRRMVEGRGGAGLRGDGCGVGLCAGQASRRAAWSGAPYLHPLSLDTLPPRFEGAGGRACSDTWMASTLPYSISPASCLSAYTAVLLLQWREVAGARCGGQPLVTAVLHTLLFLYGLALALTHSVAASFQRVAKCVQVMWFARLAVTMQIDDAIQKLAPGLSSAIDIRRASRGRQGGELQHLHLASAARREGLPQ